jgi:hypothetical protein
MVALDEQSLAGFYGPDARRLAESHRDVLVELLAEAPPEIRSVRCAGQQRRSPDPLTGTSRALGARDFSLISDARPILSAWRPVADPSRLQSPN